MLHVNLLLAVVVLVYVARFQGRRQKNFQGGNGKKTEKIAKKDRKIALLSFYLYICTMYENPGGSPPLPPPPAAAPHARFLTCYTL